MILVVEDEQPVRDMLTMLLEEDGYEVVQASQGEQALALVDSQRPDLVIADVMMPVLDGAEMCRRLKANKETDDIPVILMSSASRYAGITKADAFVQKPFQIATIETVVEELLAAAA